MDYLDYQQYREILVKEKPGVLRLDCMNHVKSLSKVLEKEFSIFGDTILNLGPRLSDAYNEPDENDLYLSWSKSSNIDVPEERRVLNVGVRDVLAAIFNTVAQDFDEVWLPNDVYPKYWELARDAGIEPMGYDIIPSRLKDNIDLSFLDSITSNNAMIVMPAPLSPLGRYLNSYEKGKLSNWVGWAGRTNKRSIVFDMVYSFNEGSGESSIWECMSRENCAALWSCSKSWVQRFAFGVAEVPEEWKDAVSSKVSIHDTDHMLRLLSMMRENEYFPARLQSYFKTEWERLLPEIKKVRPSFKPPDTGYFSILPFSFDKLYKKHDILGIPPSVFGSDRTDITIISCLYDLQNNL